MTDNIYIYQCTDPHLDQHAYCHVSVLSFTIEADRLKFEYSLNKHYAKLGKIRDGKQKVRFDNSTPVTYSQRRHVNEKKKMETRCKSPNSRPSVQHASSCFLVFVMGSWTLDDAHRSPYNYLWVCIIVSLYTSYIRATYIQAYSTHFIIYTYARASGCGCLSICWYTYQYG